MSPPPDMPSPVQPTDESGAPSVTRPRGAASLQASRFLARHLLVLPGALDASAVGADGVLIAALSGERPIPPSYHRLSSAIEAGSWGDGLEQLGDAFDCEQVARDLLGLLVAPELDPEVRLAYARAFGREDGAGLDLDVLRLILDPLGQHPADVADALDHDAPLHRYALVESVERGGRTVLRPARRLARFIFDLPARFLAEPARDGMRLVTPSDDERERFAPLVDPVLEAMRHFPLRSHWLFLGPAGVGQEQAAAFAVAREGLDVLVADLPVLLAAHTPTAALSLILREARLCLAAPLLCGIEAFFDAKVSAAESAAVLRQLAFEDGPIFYASVRRLPELSSWLRERGQPEAISLPTPDGDTRLGLWRRELPDADENDLAFVAQAFALGPRAIRRSARAARNQAMALRTPDQTGLVAPNRMRLETACRDETTHALHHLSARVTVRVDWNEVVLASETMDTIHEIIATALHRKQVYEAWGFRRHVSAGGGLSVLFSGEPGTGKTLIAGLVARELGIELYRVDLSRIVSKYVGETEKQLGQIFDEAQAARVALLFDEADSLFAKRTEVKSSVDRYANLEVNYLLQKMEEFDGLTILTTNFKKSIDEAFMRRIRYRVEFPFPEVPERARIWEALLPPEAPIEAPLDFEGLATRYKMTGGHIRNALVRAAFSAAGQGLPISQAHLEYGATAEYREMGRLMHA